MDQRYLIIRPDDDGSVTVTPQTPISRALDILREALQDEPLYQFHTHDQP
jgi:hypothetical protein